jgi:hypothetical protein
MVLPSVVSEWLLDYLVGLVVVVGAVILLFLHSRRVGIAALRVVTWSLAGGLGVGSVDCWTADVSGYSYGRFYALLTTSTLASIPAFGIVVLAVVVLRIFFRRGFEGLERLPWIAVAVVVFLVGAISTFLAITHD